MSFRFSATKVHLTYKTHLDFEKFKAEIIAKLPKVKMWSFVHENGDAKEKDPTPYAHTHVFIWTQTPMQTIDSRYFDIDEIHPNIKNRRSIQWAKTIVMSYHKGIKHKEDGGEYKIPPVFLFQFGVEEWKIDEDKWSLIKNAPTVEDACLEVDIGPRTIMDVIKIRELDRKRKADVIDEDADPANFKDIEWDRTKALILRGPSGTCKTNWAIYQFKVPMKIEDLDELKHMPPGCDGIVFDECLFDKCCKKTMVSLLDYKQPRTIRTRNVNAHIPRGMSKIFICNEHEHPFGYDPNTGGHASVTSRYNLMDVDVGTLVHDNKPR